MDSRESPPPCTRRLTESPEVKWKGTPLVDLKSSGTPDGDRKLEFGNIFGGSSNCPNGVYSREFDRRDSKENIKQSHSPLSCWDEEDGTPVCEDVSGDRWTRVPRILEDQEEAWTQRVRRTSEDRRTPKYPAPMIGASNENSLATSAHGKFIQ